MNEEMKRSVSKGKSASDGLPEDRPENVQTKTQGGNGEENPLGAEPVSSLMVRFAVPSIVAMLVSALYNIVDQLFIGQAVGTLGNAATNVAFPLTTSCVALALMFGIGGASCFNLNMGRGNKEQAIYFVGNALVCLAGSGLLLCILTQIFMEPLLILFGRAGQCVALCKDVCEDYGGGISVSDSDHWRLSSDSCRRQPADGR